MMMVKLRAAVTNFRLSPVDRFLRAIQRREKIIPCELKASAVMPS
jgi:hypothetical protein